MTRRPPLEGVAAADGPVLLLVHGAMDRRDSFRRLMRRLPTRRIVTYDRRGYGGSFARGPSEQLDDQVEDLLEVLDGEPAVVFGHSFGATVSLTAAARRPELVTAVFAWEPPMPWLDWWPSSAAGRLAATDGGDPQEVAEAFMRRVVGDRIWDRLPAATQQARRDEGATLIAELRGIGPPAPWAPADITVPVLVGCGSQTLPQHLRATAELAAALPDAARVVVEGAPHGAHLSHEATLASMLETVVAVAGAGGGMGRAFPAAAESRPIPNEERSA